MQCRYNEYINRKKAKNVCRFHIRGRKQKDVDYISDYFPLVIYIKIFKKNYFLLTIWFGEKFDEEKYISFFRFDGEQVSADMIDWKEATISDVNGYYLNLVQVPEPAQWSMILGSLALGVALYRRRK